MRSIVQELLTGNPCGEAARSELEAGVSGASEVQMQAIARAMSILLSDDCEVSEVQQSDAEAQLQGSADEQLQDGIDEMMDAEEEGEGAFIQMDQTVRFSRFMRGVGVFFLMLFLLLACVGVSVYIGLILGSFIVSILARNGLVHYGHQGFGQLTHIFYGGAAGAALGLAGCANQLYTNLLPRLGQ